jgi:hypothetical protein
MLYKVSTSLKLLAFTIDYDLNFPEYWSNFKKIGNWKMETVFLSFMCRYRDRPVTSPLPFLASVQQRD